MAKTGVTLKKNMPSPANSTEIIGKAIARAWAPVGDKHVRKRDTLVRPWQTHNRPDFEVIGPTSNVHEVAMSVKMTAEDANQAKIPVYALLDKGTDVRHVRVTEGFKPQTAVGVITSGPKTGDIIRMPGGSPVIFRNEADGQEARNFDQTINEDLEPDLVKATVKGFANGMKEVLR